MTDDKCGDHHVVDQVICTDRLAGYYIIDGPRGGPRRDGTEPGLLYVEKRSDGRWYDSELDCRITAMEVVLAPPRLRVVGDAAPAAPEMCTLIEDEYYRIFVPNPGECARAGVLVKTSMNITRGWA